MYASQIQWTHTCMFSRTCAYMCTYTLTYIGSCTPTCTYTQSYIHAHKHKLMHTWISAPPKECGQGAQLCVRVRGHVNARVCERERERKRKRKRESVCVMTMPYTQASKEQWMVREPCIRALKGKRRRNEACTRKCNTTNKLTHKQEKKLSPSFVSSPKKKVLYTLSLKHTHKVSHTHTHTV